MNESVTSSDVVLGELWPMKGASGENPFLTVHATMTGSAGTAALGISSWGLITPEKHTNPGPIYAALINGAVPERHTPKVNGTRIQESDCSDIFYRRPRNGIGCM